MVRIALGVVSVVLLVWLCFFTDMTALQSILLAGYFVATYVVGCLANK